MIDTIGGVIAIDIAVTVAVGRDRTGDGAGADGRCGRHRRFIFGAGAQGQKPASGQSQIFILHINSLYAGGGKAVLRR
jgi:hypothetical protein